MKTELTRTCGMFPAERSENEIDACSRDGAANGFLPAGVAQVPKDELQRFLKCKRVGNYLIGKTIGEGSFARVKQGFHVLAGEKVAVKIIDKKKAHQDKYVSRNMRREAKIMQMVRHPHIVQLLEVVETEHRYYLMTELAAGGDLMDYICYRRKLGEVEVRKFIRQIVSAVYYLHQGGILHRDLKVENLLLDEDYNIKIIDFGLSNTLHVRPSEGQSRAEHLKTQCGSPAYAAPEILGHKPYGPGVDVWSIGVNMFAMLTGKLPYTAEPFNITTLYNKMRRNEMNPIPSHLSSSCQDLIQRFLTFHPEKRITLEQALTHEWLQKGFSEPVIPIQFPNYPREEDLNNDVTQHMVNKMEFNEQEVVDAVTQNRATPVSTVYHLLGRRLMKYSLKHPDKMNKHINEARLRASTPDEKLTSTTESVSRSRATGRKTKHMNFSEETEQTVDSVDACESNGEDNEEKDSDKLNVPARRARLSSPSREDLSAANSQNFGVMGDVQDSAGIANVENETNGNQSDDQKDRSCSISSDAGLEISRKTSCDCSSVGMMAINGRKLSLNLSHISVESKSTTVKETLRNTSLTISSLKNFANHRVPETVEKISSIPVDALKQEQTGRKGTNEKTPPKQRPKVPSIGKVSPISAKIISIPLKQVKQDPCDKAKSHSRRFSFPHSSLPASRLSRTLGTSHQAALGPFSFNSSLRPTSINERQTQQVSPSLPPYGLCCQLTAVKNRDVESAELHACACDAKSRDNRNQRPLYHRHSVAVTGGKELLKSINNTLGKLVELSENEPSKTKDGLLMRSRLPRSILNASSQHEAAVEGVKTTLLPEHRGLKRAKEKRAAGLRISCSVKDSHSRTSSSLPSPMGTSSPDSKQLMNVEKEIMQERGARRRRRKTEDNNVFASNRDRAVSPNTQQ